MAEAPSEPLDPPPGVGDDTASGDPLVAGLRAVRDTPAQPDASDIAADDVGATAEAEKMGAPAKTG